MSHEKFEKIRKNCYSTSIISCYAITFNFALGTIEDSGSLTTSSVTRSDVNEHQRCQLLIVAFLAWAVTMTIICLALIVYFVSLIYSLKSKNRWKARYI